MRNYLKADFHRIMTKKSRALLMLLLTVYAIGSLAIKAGTKDALYMTSEIANVLLAYGIAMLIVNLFTVYGDDFRAGSMKTAIGLGLERWKIVVAKVFILSVTTALDLVFLLAVQMVFLAVLGKLTGGFIFASVVIYYVETWAQIVMWTSLASIVLFWKQKVILGILVYIYLMLNVTEDLISMAANNPIVGKFQLWKLSSGTQIEQFFYRLFIGRFDVVSLLGILIYAGAGIGIAIYLFHKKELDF